MNKVLKRLKSKAGETLVESMAAILIFTFGSIIMLSMVTAAADINTAAKEADVKHMNEMACVESADGAFTDAQLTFTYASSQTEAVKVDVYRYVDDNDVPGELYAYYPDRADNSPESEG